MINQNEQFNKPRKRGFTILETLLFIAFVGIMLTLGYPSYVKYTAKLRRDSAKITLLNLATQMHDYYQTHQTYEGVKSSSSSSKQNDDTIKLEPRKAARWYEFKILEQSKDKYLIGAIPLSDQVQRDQQCGTLTIDQNGTKGVQGKGNTATCWGA